MEEKIIIAGFGGQGVLSLGQFIAYSAIHDNKEVTWLPSYGPEMRGGTSNCSVVVSDKPVASPIIAAPDCLIAMNKPSLNKFEGKVRKGGIIIVQNRLIDTKVERDDVKAYYI
ncbi:MAG: 2-oxoacid:acceptor oxidoreductase family protein, partial [Clostridia bacterium]|nr:2-oxoacid:acceptor oxidoreductase family protein [Clostridia bacterium]